jgi:hypothetical protein
MSTRTIVLAGAVLLALVQPSVGDTNKESAPPPTTVKEMKSAMAGTWVSLAPEVRPSKNPDGTIKAFYLSRTLA